MKSSNKLTKTLSENNIHYFDYAATTFMPQEVIDKWIEVNTKCGVSIGRGNSILTKRADKYFKESNKTLLNFFDLNDDYVNIFGKNVTEIINIVALGLEHILKPLDIIVVGPYEHHSNYLPWKYLAKRTGALFFEIPLLENGDLDYSYINRYKDNIKIISVSSVSNSFGYKIDINKLCSTILNDTLLFVDDSQLVAHEKICSNRKVAIHFLPSHKMYGPKGIACASIRKDIINKINPVLLGGGMVENVSYEDTWNKDENKFISGTFDVSLLASFAQAAKFLTKNNYTNDNKIDKYYNQIYNTLIENGYKVIDIPNNKVKYIISFIHPNIHAHDIQEYLGSKNIVIRSGNLCSQNSIRKLEINAINRISLGIDVSKADVDILCEELRRIVR